MNFNKITEFCEKNRISIPELADQIGVSKPGLYRSIQNKSMKVETLEKIAKALNVSITQFFDDVMTKWESQNEEYLEEVSRLREENEKLTERCKLSKIQELQIEKLMKELELEKHYLPKEQAKVVYYRRFRLLFEKNAKSLCKSNLTKKESDIYETLIKYAEFLKRVIDHDIIWANATFTNQELLEGINGLMNANELFTNTEARNISHQSE